MDFRGFSWKMKDMLQQASLVRNKDNGRAYEYDLVILFARIWFLKAEIFAHRSSNPITASVEDFIKGLHQGSRFLHKSFCPHELEEKTTEHQILKLLERLPGQVESLCESSQYEESVGNRVRDLLYKFLVQVVLFKAEVLLLELLKNEISLMVPLNKQIGILREGLTFLIKSDINQPKEDAETEEEKLIFADIEGFGSRVISFCDSYPADRNRIITEEAVNDMEFQLSNLLVKVQLLKAKLKELYFQIPRLNFPKTPGLGSIKSLLQNLKQLPSREHDSQACAKHQIEVIHGDLEFIVFAYGHVFDEHIENQEESIDDIRTGLVDAAYQVEHVIDSMALGRDPLSQQLMWLYHLSEVIIHVKTKLINYVENNTNTSSGVGADTDPYGYHQHLESRPTTSIIREAMVGLREDKSVIIDRLTRGKMDREVVSITGMGGIGKTTLAKNVFSDFRIVNHFHIRVWCNVSQTYSKRNLLIGILSQLIEITSNKLTMSEEDLEFLVYKNLKGRRYLIVLDDIWSTRVWDELCGFFPDDCNGSRVLMISRLSNVVPNPHPLNGLSDDESWELLKMKIFGHNLCPPELLEVGKKIAKTCEGLPLAIVVVAHILVGAHEYKWREIAERLSSLTVKVEVTEYMNIFELSYKNLPDQLKECFIYFGVFPRDEDISVRKLFWLWIAEGFIPKVESKTLENLAEDYLTDLIQRSLVMASKRRSNGKVKTCRVPGLILDFCTLKAKDAKFSQLLSGNPSYCSSDDTSHDEHCNPPEFINSEHYRLSICGDTEQYIASRPSGTFVRSLLFVADEMEMYPGCHRDVSFISDNFKLLKVLDLESINVGNTLENGIDLPVHLKYLAVGGDMDSLPSSLSKLQNLEILVVKGLTNKFVLQDTIWNMTKLRHIRVTNHCIFTFPDCKNGNYSGLNSLVSLSMPSFSCGDEETNSILRKLPNLQRLKCKVLEPPFGCMHVCVFLELGSLPHLESLKLSYSGRPLNTVELNLPSCLKELTLSNFRLPWNQISAIGRLPNLKLLKLISRAFEGTTWEMREGEFLKLEYLKLDSINIIHWYADDDHLPFLEQLVLRNCKQLQEVPQSFGDILRRIEVHQCAISAQESVRKIFEDQLDMGNEDLIINVS